MWLLRWVMKPIQRIALLAVIIPAIAVGAALIHAYVSYHRDTGASHRGHGGNAVWLAHKWVGAIQSDNTYRDLAAHLARHKITDAFFHVGPLRADGTIDVARYPAAERLAREMRRHAPALRVQAWIGQIEKRGGGPLDLSRPDVRKTITATAAQFLELGFDGIHYNIEPSSGNPHLLTLLDATRKLTRGQGAMLSMATDEIEPFPGLAWLTQVAGTHAGFWTAEYHHAVSQRVDQIAVMMYDTGLPADWLYGTFVAWQTRKVQAITPDAVTVFMGVPTYEEQRLTFHPDAENMQSALRGIRNGLAADPALTRHLGVAIYANWTTDDPEWRRYRRDWLGLSD